MSKLTAKGCSETGRFDELVKDLGDCAKRQKEIPKIESLGIVFGDSCKRQKVIPKDIMEKVWSNLTVKEY